MNTKDSKINGYHKSSITTVIGVETTENVIAKNKQDALFTAKFTEKILLNAGLTDSIQKLNQDALLN